LFSKAYRTAEDQDVAGWIKRFDCYAEASVIARQSGLA
jgi:hypothetical protein